MSIVERYENQTVTLQRKIGFVNNDEWQGVSYDAPEDLRCRYEPKSGDVTTATGQQTRVESRILTTTEVALGDLIEGSEIKRIEPIIKKRGTVEGYQVFL